MTLIESALKLLKNNFKIDIDKLFKIKRGCTAGLQYTPVGDYVTVDVYRRRVALQFQLPGPESHTGAGLPSAVLVLLNSQRLVRVPKL